MTLALSAIKNKCRLPVRKNKSNSYHCASQQKATPLTKSFMTAAYANAAQQLLDEKRKSKNGRAPIGFMNKLLNELQGSGYFDATRDKVNYYKLKLKQKIGSVGAAPMVAIPLGFTAEESTNGSSLTNDSSISVMLTDAGTSMVTKRSGRPKGTTCAGKKKEIERIESCKTSIVKEALKVKQQMNADGKRTKRGFLAQLIKQKKEEFELGDDVVISIKTIRNRMFYNLTDDVTMGPKSPMHDLEDMLVDVLIKMCQCRQPLTRSEGLAFANSLIKGTPYEEKVIKFQCENCKGTMKESTKKGELGMQYWKNFLKRNSHRIVSKRGEKFASNRADWSTYKIFEEMYNHIYIEMEDAGLTAPFDSPVLMDLNGNIVADGEGESTTHFGLPVTHQLIHPDHLLFMDEIWINTNQKGDGHVGGEKYLCE